MKLRPVLFFTCLAFLSFAATPQSAPTAVKAPAATAKTAAPAAGTASVALSSSASSAVKTSAVSKTGEKSDTPSVSGEFRTVSLGQSIEAVKAALVADSVFGYRGERDVSLLAGENRTLIETSGPTFIKRAWFQFFEDKLYIMSFSLDPDKLDYYSVYSHLVEKYGEPASLDPRKALWSDDKVMLSLERPLTVKYTDAETFNKLLETGTTAKAVSDIDREGFINGF